MTSTVRTDSLFYAGLACVLFRWPLQYLFGSPDLGQVLIGVGIVLLCIALVANASELNLGRRDILIAVLFFSILVLHCLQAAVGTPGEDNRSLWLAGLVQFLVVVLFLHNRRRPQTSRIVALLLLAALLTECVLAGLQVSYYSIGVGLQPNSKDYEELSLVSGSFFNANDLSVFVVSYCIALYAGWTLESKDARGYLVIGASLIAVVVSISRTAFVFMILFSVVVLLRAGRRIGTHPLRKGNLPDLLAILVVAGGLILLLGAEFLAESSVYERMVGRIGEVGELATDDSGSARTLVYVRLFQHLSDLWFGTFADQNYARFFELGDLPLMMSNPHSFVAEFSFLYGWLGLLIAAGLIGVIVIGIMTNRDLPLPIRLVAAGSLIFFQSVPSSVLMYPCFFLPYLLLIYSRKGQPVARGGVCLTAGGPTPDKSSSAPTNARALWP